MTVTPAVIIFENYAEDAALSGGSYDALLPLTNLQDRDQGIVARTTDATLANTKIVIALQSTQTVGGVIVVNGNWSLDSQYRVQSCDASDFVTIKYDSGWKDFPGFVVDTDLLDPSDPDADDGVLNDNLLGEFPLCLIEVIPTTAGSDARARYWRILFDDESNADGYLQYGYLMVGRAFRPGINYGEENGFGISAMSDMSESLSGKRTWFERGIRRTWSAAFKFLTSNELFGTLTRMTVKSRDSRPVFIVPDESDVLHLQARSFLATFRVLPRIQQLLLTEMGATAVEFEELK